MERSFYFISGLPRPVISISKMVRIEVLNKTWNVKCSINSNCTIYGFLMALKDVTKNCQVKPFTSLVWFMTLTSLAALALLLEMSRRWVAPTQQPTRISDSLLFPLAFVTAEHTALNKILPKNTLSKVHRGILNPTIHCGGFCMSPNVPQKMYYVFNICSLCICINVHRNTSTKTIPKSFYLLTKAFLLQCPYFGTILWFSVRPLIGIYLLFMTVVILSYCSNLRSAIIVQEFEPAVESYQTALDSGQKLFWLLPDFQNPVRGFERATCLDKLSVIIDSSTHHSSMFLGALQNIIILYKQFTFRLVNGLTHSVELQR